MKKQNLIKKIMIALAVFIISIQTVNANENKTITPKEFVSNVAEVPSKVGNWFTGEVEKTKEFQKDSWAEAKTKWPWNKIFKEETQ